MTASRHKSWAPQYALTATIAKRLMEIEAARAVVENTTLPPAVEAELRHRARVRSTHYSTRIEGNRLKDGWLVMAQASKRARAYELAESYRQFNGNLTAIGTHKHYG